MSSRLSSRGPRLLSAVVLLFGVAHSNMAGAATIQVVNLDPAGVGFNDPTPAAPAPNNSGETVGEQKLAVVQWAANRLGQLLYSPVPIVIEVSHDDTMFCSANTGALAAAGPSWLLRRQGLIADHPNVPTWYPAALGQRLLATTLFAQDVSAAVNPDLGASDCLNGFEWYFGLDGDTPMGAEPFVNTILHELTHGVGFAALVGTDGMVSSLDPTAISPYFAYAYDTGQQKYWWQLNASERVSSATGGLLVWAGPRTTLAAGALLTAGLDASDHPFMYTPAQYAESSSLSHFDLAVSPDLLMEPYSAPAIDVFTNDIDLGLEFLQDLGWRDLGCGNGIRENTEECDFGAGNDPGADAPDECTTACTWWVQDDCPNDPLKLEAGLCGCDVADSDTDSDQIPDCHDACPSSAGNEPDGCPPDAGADAAADLPSLGTSESTGSAQTTSFAGTTEPNIGTSTSGMEGTSTAASSAASDTSDVTVTAAQTTDLASAATATAEPTDPVDTADTTSAAPGTTDVGATHRGSTDVSVTEVTEPDLSTQVSSGGEPNVTEGVTSERGVTQATTDEAVSSSPDHTSATTSVAETAPGEQSSSRGPAATSTNGEETTGAGPATAETSTISTEAATSAVASSATSSSSESSVAPDAGAGDAGIGNPSPADDGCQCTTPGVKHANSSSRLWLGLLVVGIAALRRHRRAESPATTTR